MSGGDDVGALKKQSKHTRTRIMGANGTNIQLCLDHDLEHKHLFSAPLSLLLRHYPSEPTLKQVQGAILDAFSHLYKRVCPSVGQSVGHT